MTFAVGRIFGGCAETRCSHVRRLSIRLPLTPYLSPHSLSLSISHCPSTISSTQSSPNASLLALGLSIPLAHIRLIDDVRTDPDISPVSLPPIFHRRIDSKPHSAHTYKYVHTRVCVSMCTFIMARECIPSQIRIGNGGVLADCVLDGVCGRFRLNRMAIRLTTPNNRINN